MGFFSGLVSSPKVNTPASGLYAQPKPYQNLYNNTANAANSALFPNGQLNTGMFQPAPTNQFETNAQNMITRGVTPTPESFQSDLSMLQNPFDEYVINELNRQSQGQNSLVNQNASMLGQQGSNRQFLGSSDVEQNRLNNIGMFRQSQYNNAVNQALGLLAGLRQQDIGNNMLEGQNQRDIAMQGQQAPLAALQAALAALGGLPGIAKGNAASSSGGGLNAGSILNTAGTIAGFFSDERLKENIVALGLENGFPVYEFSYKGDPRRYVGVMAQEVQEIMPDAVADIDGWLAVDYTKLGVEFREVG